MKKLILTISIIALLSLIFVFAVSASEFDFIQTNDENLFFDDYPYYSTFDYEVSDSVTVSICYFEKNNTLWIQPYQFKLFVDSFMGSNGDCDYSIFIESCEYICYSDLFEEQYSLRTFCGYWESGYYGFDEACFNKLYYYKEITQEELDAKDEIIAGMQNGINTLDSMYQSAMVQNQTLIGENTTLKNENSTLQSSVNNLSQENTSLSYEKEMLNQQVTDLVNEKTTINSELMAMEAKLEREKSKAYLQGYEDADGFSWLPIIACLSVVSIFSTVISIALRARKKKR